MPPSTRLFTTLTCLLSTGTHGVGVISWISSPVAPGETALVLGDGFTPASIVTIQRLSSPSSPAVNVTPIPNHTQFNTLKFTLPPDLTYDAYSISIDGGAQVAINSGVGWWFQGDTGDKATPGGWIRVFGPSVGVVPNALAAARARVRELKSYITSPAAGALDAFATDSDLINAAAALVDARRALDALTDLNSTLKLTHIASGVSITLPVDANASSQYSALFNVPADFPLNASSSAWSVQVSNGLGPYSPVSAFIDGDTPALDFIRMVAHTSPWPPVTPIFTVNVTSLPMQPDLNGSYPNGTSDAAMQAALDAAASAGGGVVYLPRGMYFVTRPINLPPRTVLVGAGMDLTSIVLMETPNVTTAPVAWITSNATGAGVDDDTFPTLSSWGLTDLTLFASSYHNIIIDASNATVGFTMRRVRTRVNAFLSQNGVGTQTHNRWANFTLEQPGPLLRLNARIFEVTDCDLYSTYDVITSMYTGAGCDKNVWPNHCHGAFWGVVAGNTIHNGGTAHFMNQWNQVIFERNVIMGISVISMGQAVGSAPWGGYTTHVYVGDNTYRFVYGNDREVMTFDDAGGSYFGTLEAVSGTTLVTSNDCWLAQSMEWGGWTGGAVVILNGTGAGQWRRIVVPNGNATLTPGNRTWMIDSPFTVAPTTVAEAGAAASFVEILPFRGQIIFHRNEYKDTGAFQFYGHAVSNIIADNTAERFGSFISWGQWRGWIPPPANASEAADAVAALPRDALGGVMGNGMQINLQQTFVDNTVLEGNTIVNYNISQPLENFYHHCAYVLLPAESEGKVTPTPHNYAIVMRRNAALSNGGVWVGESTSNVVLEAFNLTATDVCVDTDAGTSLIYETMTQCSSD